MKLTRNRNEILNIILGSARPINAKSLKERVDFNLSTVYRALDFLERNRYICSFNMENETYYYKDFSGQFFICGFCRQIEPLSGILKENQSEKEELEEKGFTLETHLSIYKGKCPSCCNS